MESRFIWGLHNQNLINSVQQHQNLLFFQVMIKHILKYAISWVIKQMSTNSGKINNIECVLQPYENKQYQSDNRKISKHFEIKQYTYKEFMCQSGSLKGNF